MSTGACGDWLIDRRMTRVLGRARDAVEEEAGLAEFGLGLEGETKERRIEALRVLVWNKGEVGGDNELVRDWTKEGREILLVGEAGDVVASLRS